MVTLRRAQIVNLVEHSYYSNIDFRRLGTVLDCFVPGALLSVDGRNHHGRDRGIKTYLTQMLATYPAIRHELLSHEVDEAAQRSTCQFILRLEDAEGQARAVGGTATFRLENGKLATVTVESDGSGPLP
ncbi:MAG: nuclear transport factor 2 family protein [Rhodospirillales bacterium]|nr:nuclear transport factor 2 family protein [Rhodospirillales bacterium]MDE0380801.1 nuclear transport factor 2 family protein [Rhodospirillales bacterium]